ncbi:MAG: Uma2 family endonuclease [Rubrobacter sp.]|nr:Uma2 family endonuclease [Rubrobacter sp.]
MEAVKHRFTVEEYRKMGEAGIFHEDDRVELIDGEVVEMAAIGVRHVESVMRLNRILSRWALETGDENVFVSVQNPMILSEFGEPRPDLTLVRRSEGRFGTPVPEDIFLIVEVADTSLAYDRNVKLPLYAGVGIPEAWIVNLNKDDIEVHSESGRQSYAKTALAKRGKNVVSATLENLSFAADGALPPDKATR